MIPEPALWITTAEMKRVIELCEVFDQLYELGYESDKNPVSLDSVLFDGVNVYDEAGGYLGKIGMDDAGKYGLFYPEANSD